MLVGRWDGGMNLAFLSRPLNVYRLGTSPHKQARGHPLGRPQKALTGVPAHSSAQIEVIRRPQAALFFFGSLRAPGGVPIHRHGELSRRTSDHENPVYQKTHTQEGRVSAQEGRYARIHGIFQNLFPVKSEKFRIPGNITSRTSIA